jgi:tubulin polyglutamylase TTLL5
MFYFLVCFDSNPLDFLLFQPDQISSDEQVVVAKYISDPLCIDGHKCDIRIYAAVTSFDPLIIYIYEEGLVRLATVKYERNVENLWNPCMHLCNYSINKYHTDYIKSMDAGDEDVGHKWTLSALLRHLRNQGCNTEQLMLNIEDVIIKSILSCAQPIVAACRMFVPNQNNCFELFGFDILIDDTLKPWLLEVNLSPSLGCDTPLDTKVKACLLTDLLTLVGIPALSPLTRASYEARGTGRPKLRSLSCYRRGNSADFGQAPAPATAKKEPRLTSLTPDEARIVRAARIQYERHGGFVRIFPTRDSMQKYGNFLDPVTGIPTSASTTPGTGHYLMIIPHNYNQMLHSQLYPASGEMALTTSYVETENTGVLYRIQKYERALESSLPIVIAPTRTSMIPKSRDEARRLRQQVKKSIENNNELSTLQARKAFTLYLECILRRLTTEPKYQHEDLVLKFLYRVGVHMKQPFFIRNFNPKIGAKERGAMVAKQLGDFLYLYTKETESYVDSFDHVGMVPIKLFDDFLSHAQEADVESVLTLHTNLTKQMSFLYTQSTISTPPTPPIPVGVHGLLKALPSMAPGGARDLSRIDAYKTSSENVKKHTKLDKKNAESGGRSGVSVTTGKLSPIKKKFPTYTKP